jgi:hypothetical protein
VLTQGSWLGPMDKNILPLWPHAAVSLSHVGIVANAIPMCPRWAREASQPPWRVNEPTLRTHNHILVYYTNSHRTTSSHHILLAVLYVTVMTQTTFMLLSWQCSFKYQKKSLRQYSLSEQIICPLAIPFPSRRLIPLKYCFKKKIYEVQKDSWDVFFQKKVVKTRFICNKSLNNLIESLCISNLTLFSRNQRTPNLRALLED